MSLLQKPGGRRDRRPSHRGDRRLLMNREGPRPRGRFAGGVLQEPPVFSVTLEHGLTIKRNTLQPNILQSIHEVGHPQPLAIGVSLFPSLPTVRISSPTVTICASVVSSVPSFVVGRWLLDAGRSAPSLVSPEWVIGHFPFRPEHSTPKPIPFLSFCKLGFSASRLYSAPP